MYPSKWQLGLYSILNTIKWQTTVVAFISQNFRAWGRILSYSLFKSSFCHATFVVLHCSPHDWAFYLHKRTLHMQQTTFTLQNLRTRVKQGWSRRRDEARLSIFLVSLLQRMLHASCFTLASLLLHSSFTLASRAFKRVLLLRLLLLLLHKFEPGFRLDINITRFFIS